MKTIKELNEKTLWRFLKYIYFWSAIILFLSRFILEHPNYNTSDENHNEIKKQLAFLYSEYEKQDKDINKFIQYDFQYYKCSEAIRKYEYKYKNYKRNNFIPSFIRINDEWEFDWIYTTFTIYCFSDYYESWQLKNIYKNWRNDTDWNYFRTYIVDLIWFFATLFILTTFLQRSIYYIFLWSFNPKKETS